KGGVIRTLGRPGGAHWTPTLAAVAAALPPKGEEFAPWDGPGAVVGRRRLWPRGCAQRGSNSRLGTARRRSLDPHACGCRRCAAPKGGVIRALGRPGGGRGAPAPVAAWLRPKGE